VKNKTKQSLFYIHEVTLGVRGELSNNKSKKIMLDHFGNLDWSWLIENCYIWTATYTEQLHKTTFKHYSNWDPNMYL